MRAETPEEKRQLRDMLEREDKPMLQVILDFTDKEKGFGKSEVVVYERGPFVDEKKPKKPARLCYWKWNGEREI